MRQEVFMSGLGGQGIMLSGQVLAQAALDAGLQLSWFPSYSPEVRGGEANCTLVVSDGRVGSPITGSPGTVILMAPAAVDAYLKTCAPGGLAIINSGLGPVEITRDDLRIVQIDANALAIQAGGERMANMAMLGAWIAVAWPELLDVAIAALTTVLPERHHKWIPSNAQAMRLGAAAATAESA
jgi:2-oxoglutarate ferredoxin oxidoreductase subunit gamma